MFSEATLQISVCPLLSRLPWWHANRKCSWFFSLDQIFVLSIRCALSRRLKQTNKQFEKKKPGSVALTDGKLTCLIIILWKSLANTFLLDCLCLLQIELKLGLQLNVWKPLIGFAELKEEGKQHSMHQFWTSSCTSNISNFCESPYFLSLRPKQTISQGGQVAVQGCQVEMSRWPSKEPTQ